MTKRRRPKAKLRPKRQLRCETFLEQKSLGLAMLEAACVWEFKIVTKLPAEKKVLNQSGFIM